MHLDRRIGTSTPARGIINLIIGAAIQHGGLLVLLVDGRDALQVVGGVRMLAGDFYGCGSTQIAIPLVHPPRTIRAVGPRHVVVKVAGVVPIRGLRLHLGLLEQAQPLDDLARNRHVTHLAELADVDGTWRNA